jgi:hypothetical protein
MKKIIFLLLLHLVCANTFSQNIIFQENFEKGKVNAAWKIPAGQCSVVNLESMGIKPSAGGNNFALASTGNADILIDLPVENNSLSITTQFTFDYWITNKNAKATVSISFLKENGDFISSVNFADLSDRPGWDFFNQQFKIPGGTSVMRLKLVARAPSVAGNTVYFQSFCFGCNRRR